MKTAIAYTRVSTERQGRSGLGLEAQQAALVRFAQPEGYDLIQTFEEVETGKGSTRSTAGRNSQRRWRWRRSTRPPSSLRSSTGCRETCISSRA
jgi:hypothetical protein